ncbi:hypothetical protein M409DRAFT_51301 [Zasmidium cellare ATCC 36951]|uniref:Subtelomeric hrmA-associated cluster protein AFUB-079030/YDR124W-like helical bundle domain-containing protein n=1 Tax=Zasmidium cellare ATCC 36951 TaxID=1080233 RepID=A0A6A6CY07_ZASCE|nr:uncharacterized protein M409DRAFT_51301 [Zasmidium cellare ATCC 36951]KAF2171078.1 hypothetical protein M409DRAFT_51301 [Zasmidium cellare ATCC 36951]
MVDTPDVLMHGRSLVKHTQQVIHRDETIQSFQHALAAQGIDSKQSFAFIGFDENGNIRIHASGQVKGFLDEQQMESGFQEAYEKAVHESFIVPEPTSAISIDEDQGSDYGDDEFPTLPRTSGAAQSRVYRVPRQRGDREQSMLPCNASRHGLAEPVPESQLVREVSPSEPNDEMIPRKKVSRTLRMDDTVQVVDFLRTRLKRMQQLAVKKIAKAWIKGICPKKQAKFPYQNSKKCDEVEGFKPRIPGWWPKQGCRFTEPDHIKREERMTLCLHLLRLRPTPAQLKEWNEDKSEPHPTHLTKGWTEFLQELAGASVFDDLQKEDKKKTELKKELLRHMYEVAELEEKYCNGEVDPDASHHWQEDEDESRTVLTKRPRQELLDFAIDQASRQSSESVDCRRVKRPRRDSTLDRDCKDPSIAQPSNMNMLETLSSDDAAHEADSSATIDAKPPLHAHKTTTSTEAYRRSSNGDDEFSGAPLKRDSSAVGRWRHFEPPGGNWVESAVTTHPFGTPGNHFAMPNNFHGDSSRQFNFNNHSGYTYPQQPEQPQMVQVHQVSHVPEPQFQAIQNGPMYSPEAMMPVPVCSFIPPEYNVSVSSSQPYPNSMAPSQYFMPANADSMMGDYHPPPPQPQYDQHGLAERHIAPMQVHGLPFTQPSSWQGRPFNGHCQNST